MSAFQASISRLVSLLPSDPSHAEMFSLGRDSMKLDCWIYGEDVNHCFSLPVSKKGTVMDFKNAIKNEAFARFRSVHARDLEIYSINKSGGDLSERLSRWTPDDKARLAEQTKVSSFKDMFIIINPPAEPSSVDTMTLNCWIRGRPFDTFPVKISRTETIGFLRELIKERNAVAFRDMDAVTLILYKVSVSGRDESLEASLSDCTISSLGNRLRSSQRLSDVFMPFHPGDVLHLVVDPEYLAIKCWIRGTSPLVSFYVQLSAEDDVSDLQNKMKAATRDLDNVSFRHPIPYKVPIDHYPELREIRIARGTGQLLQEDVLLRDMFDDIPFSWKPRIVVDVMEDNLLYRAHPVLEPPLPPHNLETQRLEYLIDNKAEAPSSAGKPSVFLNKRQTEAKKIIYCGRPPETSELIPATLLHAVIGKFVDDCETHIITPKDNSLTAELHDAMSRYYDDELDRARTIRGILSGGGLHFNVTQVGPSYTTDGDMSVGPYRYVIAEFKNEVGSTGAEPYLQASLYYLESTRMHEAKPAYSPFPCIFVLLFGPYIAFAGAAWNTRPVIEPLSIVLPMHYHPSNTNMRTRVARHLAALREAISTLKKYYEDFEIRPSIPSPDFPLFPHPTEFISLSDDKKKLRFKYEERAHDSKLIFFGTLDDGHAVCIKFVRQYSKDAHLECASMDYAPRLLGFKAIPGGWFMVVMDNLVKKGYIRFCGQTPSPTRELLNNIRVALEKMHQSGFVHGDVRDANIMVDNADRTKFKLIDFDWAGKLGEVVYPMNVNRAEDLWRPDEATDGEPIRAEHDILMLGEIEKRYRLG